MSDYFNQSKIEYFEDALINPQKYHLQLETIESEDYDGNTIYVHIAYITLSNIKSINYEMIDNSQDVENLICVFEKHNPEGLTDNRRYC